MNGVQVVFGWVRQGSRVHWRLAQARTGLAHLPFSRNTLLAILVDEHHKPCSGLPCVITGILRKDFAPPDGSI